MTYACPMHPEIRQETAGRCSACGMALVRAQNAKGKKPKSGGHAQHAVRGASDRHAGHSLTQFARKFWVSLALTLPVLLTSELAARLGVALPDFPGRSVLTLLLASVVFFYGGWVFLAGASREIRGRAPGMMTLIGLATTAAYAYSVAVTIFGGGEPLFWELTTLITVMLLGHWLEMRSVQGAQGALGELSKLLPDTAEALRDGVPTPVALRELRVGDRVLVRPGGYVPADGVVEDGASDVIEALVTGESRPVPKRAGSEVIAGTVNGDGALTVRVTKIGEQTFLAGVMRLVREAQASKSRLQLLADRAAFGLTVVAIVGGLVTLAAWLLLARASTGEAMTRMVAVLVIACPHALGLAVPLVASISTTLGARNGLLIRQRLALEAARTVTIVLFDKTGTLTTGQYGVQGVWSAADRSVDEVLRLAASADSPSEHAAARAIVAEARGRGIQLFPAEQFQRVPGKGVEAVVQGARVAVGGLTPEEAGALSAPARAAVSAGNTVLGVRVDGRPIGWIALGDTLRPESAAAVRRLKAAGVRLAMVTGDSEDVAAWVGRELGIDEIFSRVLPAGKAERVKALQARGERVAFVGDGINDAPALAQADVGIAIGAGTNVAIESAGILLVRNDPRDVPKILALSRATYAKMVQNLFWAAGYNVIALPLAAGVLASRGIVLQPALSALFMSLSTVIVAINAVGLRRLRLAA